MSERPTPERLAELRRMVATAWDGCLCPADLDELVAEIDALTARAVAAEQRAETAELALTLTREAGEALDGAHQRSGYAMFGRRVLAEAQAHWAATLALSDDITTTAAELRGPK